MTDKGRTKNQISSRAPGKATADRQPKRELLLVFEGASYRVLEAMQDLGGLPSAPATIHMALRIMRALQDQGLEGYSDVIVQDPISGDQRILDIPILKRQPGPNRLLTGLTPARR